MPAAVLVARNDERREVCELYWLWPFYSMLGTGNGIPFTPIGSKPGGTTDGRGRF
jgi:hypothetical protein